LPPKFSEGKKLVDLVKKIDGLFNKTKEHYADHISPVKRKQITAKKIVCFDPPTVAAPQMLDYNQHYVCLAEEMLGDHKRA